MKTVLSMLFLCFASVAFAQDKTLEKGKTIYVQQVSANDNVKDYKDELSRLLEDWGYWKLVTDKGQADYIFDLNVDSKKGITATSWGGQTVITDATLLAKNGDKLFQSEKYEASPNGLNGFNGGRASVKKLVKGLKKKFQ